MSHEVTGAFQRVLERSLIGVSRCSIGSHDEADFQRRFSVFQGISWSSIERSRRSGGLQIDSKAFPGDSGCF